MSLRAENKSPKTLRAYGGAARLFDAFAREHFGVTTVDQSTRETVNAFIADQVARWKPNTANNRYRCLQQLFKWLVEDGSVPSNPMPGKGPSVPDVPVPVVSDEDLGKFLKVCEGKFYEQVRDTGILRLMNETGIRLAECAGLSLDDLDMRFQTATVLGKGGTRHTVPFTSHTAKALDQYRRHARRRHPHVASPALWVGPKGALTDSGIAQMLERRCAEAGIPKIHPHQLRHTAVHNFKKKNGSDGDAMQIFGWKSTQMLQRYAESVAAERAREHFREMALGGRL